MRRINLLRYLPLLMCLLMACFATPLRADDGPRLQRFEFKEYHMGVDVRMVVYAPDRPAAESACAAAFERFAELDTVMSDYRRDSELMRLCARAGGDPVRVSADLFTILARSQRLARESDGAFDVTCGPGVALWRRARKTRSLPTPEEIASARSLVGWRKMRLDPATRSVRLLAAGMKLDLGAIGKGYADDCAQQVLKRHGITRALVEAGGDIVVSGPPPGRKGWSIEIPNATRGVAPSVMLFANAGISTSGDTEQFVEIGGIRYSHIIDPHTCAALTQRIGVTIIARDGTTSDGLSTAISVLGPTKGRMLAHRYAGVTVYVRTEP